MLFSGIQGLFNKNVDRFPLLKSSKKVQHMPYHLTLSLTKIILFTPNYYVLVTNHTSQRVTANSFGLGVLAAHDIDIIELLQTKKISDSIFGTAYFCCFLMLSCNFLY